MKGRFVAAVAAVAALIVASGSAALLFSDDSSDSVEPTGAEFPEVRREDASAIRQYLRGDGVVLVRMHESAMALTEVEANAEECGRRAEELDRDASADLVLSRIGGISDPVLRDAFNAERTALGVHLSRCIAGEQAQEAPLQQLPAATDVVQDRLADVDEAL